MKVNRRKGLRITTEETKMNNPSRNYNKTRKCILCGYIYEEKYGIPFGSVWVCGDCLGTIPMEDLPKILRKRVDNGLEV
jgi:rubredoxin